MLKKAIFLILITAFLLPSLSYASYFTILLKNGNNISVDNYWDINSKILYYTNTGSVELPKLIIKNISTSEGTLEPKIGFYPTDDYFDQLEITRNREELLSTETIKEPEARDDEMVEDLKDRISIMEINIDNLKKNKITYADQKKKLIDQKQGIEERINNYKNSTYTEPEAVNAKIDPLQDKISQIENKITSIDGKINQTENLLKRQESMRQRVEKQLASSN